MPGIVVKRLPAVVMTVLPAHAAAGLRSRPWEPVLKCHGRGVTAVKLLIQPPTAYCKKMDTLEREEQVQAYCS